MSSIGELINSRRNAVGLSLKNLGNACGLSDSEISKIENGTRKTPNWIGLCEIARVLNFHPFELLLAAGYISEKDIQPISSLHGLEHLDSSDMKCVQLFIDFMISRKTTDGNSKGALEKCHTD